MLSCYYFVIYVNPKYFSASQRPYSATQEPFSDLDWDEAIGTMVVIKCGDFIWEVGVSPTKGSLTRKIFTF